jgi:hypothetical protein
MIKKQILLILAVTALGSVTTVYKEAQLVDLCKVKGKSLSYSSEV